MSDRSKEDIDQFHRTFWDEKVAWKMAGDITEDGDRVVRYHNGHYIFCKMSDAPAAHRGLYGRRCEAVLLDGTVLVSNDVWHQGTIPESYRNRLPDNCTEWRNA